MARERSRGKGTTEKTEDKKAAKAAPAKNIFSNDSEIGKVIADIKKRMGDNAVFTGLQTAANTYIETGIFLLDFALLGGFQESRVNMVYGWEACGKSTAVMRAIAAAQRKYPDKVPVIIDAEGTYDPLWAARHGVDPDRLIYAQPESGEEAVDIMEAMIRAEQSSLVALDSIPAIVPQKMIERSAEDPTMAVRASLMGVCCSKILAAMSAERKRGHVPTIMLVNQWRRKVGFTMGDNRILPGGDQVRYLCSTMVEMKKKKSHTSKDAYENETRCYNEHAFDVDKLKGTQSATQGEFKMVVGEGYTMQLADADMPDIPLPTGTVDDYKAVVTYAQRMGFLTGGGSSWQLDEIDGKFKRKAEVVSFLVENPEEFNLLKRKLIAMKRKEAGVVSAIPADGWLLGKVK